MALSQFFMPSNNLIGEGALEKGIEQLARLNCKKVFIVTDKILEQIGVVAQVTKPLESRGIEFKLFTDVQPNPTVSNVNAGLADLKSFDADLMIRAIAL